MERRLQPRPGACVLGLLGGVIWGYLGLFVCEGGVVLARVGLVALCAGTSQLFTSARRPSTSSPPSPNPHQDCLRLPRGTIRATVLIETILASFEMVRGVL